MGRRVAHETHFAVEMAVIPASTGNWPMHPYLSKPDYQFWKNVARSDVHAFDPVIRTGFKIGTDDKVVTAGSCFAQHVARHLSKGGLQHFITERAHPIFPEELSLRFNYGAFSARYGNVYTARQLKQLLERAYGLFQPKDTVWQRRDGRFADPFRPQIEPRGFISGKEVLIDQRQHFARTREAVEGLSVFVFTLGLTEAWIDSRDGSVYPIAPGVAAGCYNPDIHHFKNFGVLETVEDLIWSLNFIRSRNPGARFILTVSPVPLNATALDQHVAVSTSYSKSVLRVAAEATTNEFQLCDYFPSYEIITSPISKGIYFDADCRSVREAGVEHVMSVFFQHYAEASAFCASSIDRSQSNNESDRLVREQNDKMNEAVQVLCDEELLSNRNEFGEP